jgi:hypothetical protein
MVISIETAMAHPRRGFIKLEDTVAVTEEGCEGFGDKDEAGTGQSEAVALANGLVTFLTKAATTCPNR